jgi:hypothetical protein
MINCFEIQLVPLHQGGVCDVQRRGELRRVPPGRGGIEKQYSTDLNLLVLSRASVGSVNLKVSHASMLVECSFSMTLLLNPEP